MLIIISNKILEPKVNNLILIKFRENKITKIAEIYIEKSRAIPT